MQPTHYCNWGICESWEYCCGDNVCCKESEYNSLLLTATVIGILIVVALSCACFYCSSRRVYTPFIKKYFKISYALMSTQRDAKAGTVVNEEATTEDYVVQMEKTKTSL